MNCSEVRTLISEYSLGMIEGRRKGGIEEHLAACHDCAGEFEKLNKVMLLVEGLDAKEPPPALWNGVYNRIAAPAPRKSAWDTLHQRSRGWSIGLATAALAIIMLFAHVHNPPGPENTYAANEYVQGHAMYASQDMLADQAALNSVAVIAYREQVGEKRQ